MKPAQLAKEQAKADEVMRKGWSVEDGMLIFNGKGDNLCTEKQYGDFEMYVDWMLDPAVLKRMPVFTCVVTPQVQDLGILTRGHPWEHKSVPVD